MTYDKIICSICGQSISTSGAAYTAHFRAHVNKNEAIEFKTSKGLKFMSETEYHKFVSDHPFALLGDEPIGDQPKGVWEIPDISKSMPAIDPASYYITSGEAVKKADRLVKDAYSLATKALAFRNALKKTRGKNVYLETSRDDRRLLIRQKNPRKKGEDGIS